MKMKRTWVVAVVAFVVAVAGLGETFYYLEFPQSVDEASLRAYGDPVVERML
jgi:hypothetical protein